MNRTIISEHNLFRHTAHQGMGHRPGRAVAMRAGGLISLPPDVTPRRTSTSRFDDLARAVAEKKSRRHVLKLGFAALVAGVTASVTPSFLRETGVRPASGGDEPLCPDRVPKQGHRPTVNGCGPGALSAIAPQTYGNAKLYIGCNRHDVCYETCNAVKEACDSEFLEIMKLECRRAYPPGRQDPGRVFFKRTYDACVSFAGVYHAAVSGHGAGAYKDAQIAACECCKDLETKCGQPATPTNPGNQVCCKVCETCQGDQCKPKCPDLCSPCDESTGECKQKDCPLCTDCRDGECVDKKCQTCETCFLDECLSNCPDDQECCQDQCVDPTCPPGETFNSSTCQCQCATQLCGGQCCPSGQVCCNGQCLSRAVARQGTCGSRVFCACNGQTYDDVQECLAECHVSLGCFTGICTPV